MYQVYSMTRGGRPKWAVAASAGLLVLATGMAAFVARHRSTEGQVTLGEVQLYDGLAVQLRWPTGWQVGSPERVPNGQGVVATAPGHDGRELVLFRARALLGPAPLARGAAVLRALQLVLPDAKATAPERIATGMLGDMDSEVMAVLASENQTDAQIVLANVAVTPDREIVGLVLLAGDELKSRDRRLLEEVSRTVSLQDETSQDVPTDQEEEGAPPGFRLHRRTHKPVVERVPSAVRTRQLATSAKLPDGLSWTSWHAGH